MKKPKVKTVCLLKPRRYTKVIRVDEEFYTALWRHARPKEPIGATLRRLLSLDGPPNGKLG